MSQDQPDAPVDLTLESTDSSDQSSALSVTAISVSTPDSTPVDYGAPYDDKDADLILRSSDLVDFRVHKLFLTKASPVFNALLVATGPSTSSAETHSIALSGELKDGFSVICLPENKEVFESLLSAILPVPISIPDTIHDLLPVLAAAQNYGMFTAMDLLRSKAAYAGVRDKTPEVAFRTYCRAWDFGLLQETVDAAKATLPRKLSIDNLGLDLQLITGPALDELLNFHMSITDNARPTLRNFWRTSQPLWASDAASNHIQCNMLTATPVVGVPLWFALFGEAVDRDLPASPSFTSFLLAMTQHIQVNSCRYCSSRSASFLEGVWNDFLACLSAAVTLAEWDFTFPEKDTEDPHETIPKIKDFGPPFDDKNADIILRAADDIDFRVHKNVLGIASPIFQSMFTLPQPISTLEDALTHIVDDKDGLPVVCMAEGSATLSSLLMAVYFPSLTSMPSCPEDAFELLAAAEKFEMDNTSSLIRTLLIHNDHPPLITSDNAAEAYGLAYLHHLAHEALLAARRTLELPSSLERYASDLHILDGAAIYELTCYRTRCKDAVLECLEAVKSGKSPSAVEWLTPTPAQGSNCASIAPREGTPSGVPMWWDRYLERVAEGVMAGTTNPSAKTVADRPALQLALDAHCKDESCEFCPRIYMRKEEKFCTMLEDELSKAIEKVRDFSESA
ncbi:hypothetical protein FA95DRAFT_899404 [Auriscalpium vulgare]|uniref:Uncharacterized protein n=1 Tax=Auriscalpium vulgare TaxID=40419 RepID=A0ACB8R8H3_9AGAM|nr:hypothetical protein FA95DRAFT_899404 [Auriscalpium vulgare]